jgi:hypothetical protein
MRIGPLLGFLPLVAIAASSALAASDAHPAKLVGTYDGGQVEIASGLELSKDGRFRYGLSYGALDEMAAGTWMAAADTVTLTVQQYESTDPSSDGKFGASVFKVEDGDLVLPRYDRVLRFRKVK